MSSHEKSDNKTRLPPSVSVLQEGAARPGRRLFGVYDFEAEARQLEWNLRDLHFLRQRPQGAKSGRLRHKLDLFYDSIDVVPPQPLARAQGEKEQREDVCDRVHGCRKTDLLSPGLVSSNMMSRGGRGLWCGSKPQIETFKVESRALYRMTTLFNEGETY